MRFTFLFFAVFLFGKLSFSQMLTGLIPEETATHVAIDNGDWFDPLIWDVGTVPGDAAIVYIPSEYVVIYEGASDASIFAVRVDGGFKCQQPDIAETTTMVFDSFIGTHSSKVEFIAHSPTSGKIDITITPFDIEGHKAGTSGFDQEWNAEAIAHFSDGAVTYEVTQEVGPDKRFNSYEDALVGDTEVTELSREIIDDGVGVLGRYGWDSTQISLGLILMGEVEIIGQEKLNMVKLAEDALKNQAEMELVSEPIGWNIGDEVLITRGGNLGALSNGEDIATILSITGTSIIFEDDLSKNHEGRAEDTLHCYAGNLTRNIVFKSGVSDQIHLRGHFMAMHNDENVQIRNAEFVEMGRTDKSKLVDDFIWKNWLEPKVFRSKISALGQECAEMELNPKEDISNTRGRYSIHLHKSGALLESEMVYVTGNVVRGNPGWGISHHDSYATVSNNIVYDVVGAGIISETGSETGFWDNNLVVGIQAGHTTSPYVAAVFHDDYLYSGQGLAMKGRAVICRGNVIANAKMGVGVINMNPSINNLDRVDPLALATLRPDFEFDQFPLSSNGYSSEGNGVMPVEVALIMENTTVISCNQGLRSIERDMGVNHESRSIFDGFIAWGVNQGLSITYQADYSFKNVFISGKNMSAVGAFLWKHSHNHVFENIKMVDLGYGVTVSKLVLAGDGELKTRNNGFTPWYFIDLETDNVTSFYQIIKEDEDDLPGYEYNEHGDNPIHLNGEDITPRPTTFTILDSTSLVVDYATSDLRFEVDGIISDDLGTYDLGIKQAWSQGTLRLDYPKRIYEFASTEKLEEYLTENGVYKDTSNEDQIYFIINEWLPNRLTYEYTSFSIRVKIINAPEIPLYAGALIEAPENFDPVNQIVSRGAIVSQSSTNTTIMFDTASISVPAERAIDGNNNGRINAQYYQQWLLPVGSFSETNVEVEPWYDMDLGELKTIDYLDVWNTVEINGDAIENVSPHFQNFYVLISDSAFTGLSLDEALELADYTYLKDEFPTRKYTINDMDAVGRYIRIQGIGTNKIAHAEVEVIGRTYVDLCDGVFGGTDIISACEQYTWVDGITYTESNNTATYLFETANGCDSIVTLDLEINSIDTIVITTDFTLTSSATDVDYQWLNCDDGYAIIPGATTQSFTPMENGSYAVIITDGECSDTSNCNLITAIGIEELKPSISAAIFPNPNTGEFTIDFSNLGESELFIYNDSGQLVHYELISQGDKALYNLSLASGQYHVIIQKDDQSIQKKLIVNN